MLDYLMLQWKLFKARFLGEENGAVDLIVIVILIAIVIILAIVFRNKLSELINSLFGKAKEASDAATTGVPTAAPFGG